MGSIRPLLTITVLVVAGAYLYSKINEGPVHPHGKHGKNAVADEGVPPLAATGGGATLAQDSSAPAWPATQSTAPVSPPSAPALTTPAAPTGLNASTAGATTIGSATANEQSKNGI